ncbi:MAG TPA: cupredoxin domain-containing protein [Solirubrobacteraceae bacterium]|nr:cupredoxin domain-containing protein [Solirubrobacteraceae bacterium]
MITAAGAFSAVAIAACDDADEVTADPDEEVQLRITDTALDPSRVEVAAGTIRFRIDNDSEHTHQLAVETQNGVEESNEIPAGDSGSLTVELDEGEHAMYDPLENYRDRGVNGVIVVRSQTETDTVERTVTDEETDTVIQEETETVIEEETNTVTEQETVTQQQTVTQTTP